LFEYTGKKIDELASAYISKPHEPLVGARAKQDVPVMQAAGLEVPAIIKPDGYPTGLAS